VLKQKLQQHAVELMSIEDPMAALDADERRRYGGYTTEEIGRALEDSWQRPEARVAAVEAALDKPK
jgi:hypothetical protein